MRLTLRDFIYFGLVGYASVHVYQTYVKPARVKSADQLSASAIVVSPSTSPLVSSPAVLPKMPSAASIGQFGALDSAATAYASFSAYTVVQQHSGIYFIGTPKENQLNAAAYDLAKTFDTENCFQGVKVWRGPEALILNNISIGGVYVPDQPHEFYTNAQAYQTREQRAVAGWHEACHTQGHNHKWIMPRQQEKTRALGIPDGLFPYTDDSR